MADSGQTVRIATVNVNGIRAAYRRGMAEWLAPVSYTHLTLPTKA